MLPEWKLPEGVDRGLWDYMNSEAMVAVYDAQMAESDLAKVDIAFCERHFQPQGRTLDLGCGTGRLAIHWAKQGRTCVGVDLSELMLDQARRNASDNAVSVDWVHANLLDFLNHLEGSFDNVGCLFSTLGMVLSQEERTRVVTNVAKVLKPGGCFVLHVHNRYYKPLGWRRWFRSNHTMRQAYGGAPLTLHHFSRREAIQLLKMNGFTVHEVASVGVDGLPRRSRGNVYGYLLAATRSSSPG